MLACCEDQKAKGFLFQCNDEAQLFFFSHPNQSPFMITYHDEVTVSADRVTIQSSS